MTIVITKLVLYSEFQANPAQMDASHSKWEYLEIIWTMAAHRTDLSSGTSVSGGISS